KWVIRGAPDRTAWADWVFATSHFVGYRPVAALTYTLDYAWGGWGPEVYRATDMVLFGLATVAVGALFRALVGRADVFMVLAALIFAGHPVVEEIVPFLARRSYSLAVLFSTAGLALWVEGLRRESTLTGWSFLGGLLLVLGFLSNEVAYVVLPLLPLLVLHIRGSGARDALARSFTPFVGAAVAIGLRFAIIGWTGGYVKHYFAFTRDGVKTLTQPIGFWGHAIVGAAFDYTWFPVSMSGAPNPFRAFWPDVLGMDLTQVARVLLFGVLSWYLYDLVARPLLEGRRKPLAWLLLLWMLGYGALFALVSTWFWRQAFPMVVPLALLVAWQLRETVQHGRRWELVPQVLLVVGLLWHSPIVHGMSTHKMESRIAANELLADLPGLTAEVEKGSWVFFVVPGNKGTVATVQRWIGRLWGGRGIRWVPLVHGMPSEKLVDRGEDTLVLRPRAIVAENARRVLRMKPADREIPLQSLRMVAGGKVWLVMPDEQGVWRAERLR
ncbi:MAG: hypothetical protein KC656_13940, partial [Myxococcales bacterium]|nr:hypothetical protein [Myxococcales bacterium]